MGLENLWGYMFSCFTQYKVAKGSFSRQRFRKLSRTCLIYINTTETVQMWRQNKYNIHLCNSGYKCIQEFCTSENLCLRRVSAKYFFPFSRFSRFFFSIFWLFFKVFGEIFAHYQGSSKNTIRMFILIYRFRKLLNEH